MTQNESTMKKKGSEEFGPEKSEIERETLHVT